jgi:hypothetical protein
MRGLLNTCLDTVSSEVMREVPMDYDGMHDNESRSFDF